MDEAGKLRRLRDPEVVRGRILDAAQAEFMAAGYAGASTNRMLELFGGSKPTMFRHFPTKRALFEGVIRRVASGWAEQIDWRPIPRDDPGVWLRDYAKLVLRWILLEENIFVGRVAVAEGAAFPELAGIYRELAVEPIEAVLSGQLRQWTVEGKLRCDDPQRDARSFLDLTVSGVVSRRLYHVVELLGEAELNDHVVQSVGLFLEGRRAVVGDEQG
jgi:AcrR family transcriptional regulator